MKNINSPEELYKELETLNKENKISRFSVPGKGRFTLVYEEREKTIKEEVDEDEELKRMIQESRREYKEGKYKSTSEIIKSMFNEDYLK
ncbi:hypothetical protein [Oceanobacillus halophilus]|uniref:Uncharacterized protein n=1 Tax=Oceanobacillus halophilus TaxID=930130 RepID=A0A495A4B7_9BACI|nr:hypothetical protein [Oceanobacillus halophilus]RKQ34331.1 hypothetical protein D8M06_08120 [Oceanobacillus halophilus]